MTDFKTQDFSTCRRNWLAGLCPCCGFDLKNDEEAEAVAEGVKFCGRCIRGKHHIEPEGFLEILLRSLVP